MPPQSPSSDSLFPEEEPETKERPDPEIDPDLPAAIVRSADDAIFTTNLEGVVTSWNPAAERLFGYTQHQMLGSHTTLPFFPDRLKERAALLQALLSEEAVVSFTSTQRSHDGRSFPVSLTVFPLKAVDHAIIGIATVARPDDPSMDRTGRSTSDLEAANRRLEEMNAQLEALATTDGLTGLKNHRTFMDRLDAEVARAARYAGALSIVMIDVDRFKTYNDAFGHPAGDSLLKQIGALLQSAARTTDIVARYGGDEFAVILPETDSEQARTAAERFRGIIAAAKWPEWRITASFGVATMAKSIREVAALIAEADTALYCSKRIGRDCVTHAMDLPPRAAEPDPPMSQSTGPED